jgi:Bacterial membrane protein YfhO
VPGASCARARSPASSRSRRRGWRRATSDARSLTDRFAGPTPGALALSSTLRWLLLVGSVGTALVLLRLRPRHPSLAGGTVALLAALDMLAFAHAYQPMGPASVTLPARTPAIAFLQQHAAEGRVVGVRSALFNDYAAVFGLRDVRGHDVPQPSLRFLRLWRLVHPAQDMLSGLEVARLTPVGLGVLGLLGARYVVAEPEATVPTAPGFEALTPVYRGEDATVFENRLAAPRALVARRVVVADDEEDEYAAVARPGFDARGDAVLRRDELGGPVPSGASPGDTVTVVQERNAQVVLRANLRHRGVVVLDDAWAPGWSVTVDGRPARARRADVVMRGVVVPAGEHRIEWRYDVPGLRTGALLSLSGVLAMIALAAASLRPRRRRASHAAR